jgi:BirA family biotin operon repressor/biotin-[acetyl-CoA-carboxylase] ligase
MLEPGAVPPIALADLGRHVPPAAFLDALAPAFANWERQLSAQGFAPLRAAWLARAARLGEVITARLPREEIEGRFETVDQSGAIVLTTASGRRTLPAAEIHF